MVCLERPCLEEVARQEWVPLVRVVLEMLGKILKSFLGYSFVGGVHDIDYSEVLSIAEPYYVSLIQYCAHYRHSLRDHGEDYRLALAQKLGEAG